MSKKNKKISIPIYIIILFIIMVIICITIFRKNNKDIKIYEIKTSQSFNEKINQTKYKITSGNELDYFYQLYKNVDLHTKSKVFEDKTVFIKLIEKGSGSIDVNLKNVLLDNKKVEFDIEEEIHEIGTTDMAYWYLVAIIPNEKIIDCDLSNWYSPIDVVNR